MVHTAIMGYGTVGGGVAKVIENNAGEIRKKLGEAESTVDDAAKRGEIIRKKLRDVDAGDAGALPGDVMSEIPERLDAIT